MRRRRRRDGDEMEWGVGECKAKETKLCAFMYIILSVINVCIKGICMHALFNNLKMVIDVLL